MRILKLFDYPETHYLIASLSLLRFALEPRFMTGMFVIFGVISGLAIDLIRHQMGK